MVVKTKNIEKNTKALDTKMSSAFFVLKTHISKDCYVKLLEMFEKESHAFRAFDFLHNFHQTNIYSCEKMIEEKKKSPKDPYEDGFYLSSARKRDTYEKYQLIFNKLFEENILIEVFKQVGLKAATVKINSEYLSRDLIFLELPKHYKDVQNLTIKKDKKRFKRVYGDIRIGFNISEENVVSELLKDEKDSDTIKKQLKIFRDIVIEGNLNGKKKRRSRLYSKFHELSKKITNWTTIDGKLTINLDQHATFFTILPRILTDNLYMVNENEELHENIVIEIENMQEMILETDDIYQLIADSVSSSRKEIKEKMNAFICETKKPEYLKEIYSFFEQVFPYSLQLLNKCRKLTDNYVSTKCMEIESKIFLGTSIELSSFGILSYTKHDQIFIHSESRTVCEEILKKHFNNQKVVYKVKIVDPLLENLELFSPKVENAPLSLISLDSAPDYSEKRDMRREEEEEGYYSPDFFENPVQSGADSKKKTKIKIYRNGYRVSISNKYIYSKNETKENFYKRLLKEGHTNIIFEADEQSEMSVANFKDTLTNPKEVNILEKPVEAVLSQDVDEMTIDTEITTKRPTKAPRGVSVDFDIEKMRLYKLLIEGEI